MNVINIYIFAFRFILLGLCEINIYFFIFSTGYQTIIGSNDIKSSSSYFLVRESVTNANGVITYPTITTNIGNAMNAETGIFMAPVAGTYYFSVQVNKDNDNNPLDLYLEVNTRKVAHSYCPTHASSQHCSISATLTLLKGDQVTSTKDGNNLYIGEFTGYLIEESLTLPV